jgi:hypothetical protein
MSHPEAHLGGPASPAAGRVIVVTGPPGAGKTTIARLLADEMSPSVHLHCDDFWAYIRRGGRRGRRPGGLIRADGPRIRVGPRW